MLREFVVIVVCQLLGDGVVHAWQLPVPGPVVGMGLLLGYLFLRNGIPAPMARASQPLLKHMALLFIPAGSGIMLYPSVLAGEGLAIGLAVLTSTALALVVTAWVFRSLSNTHGDKD